jgi:nitrogen fixation protein NifB
LAEILKDCNTALTAGIGPNPLRILESEGLRVLTMEGMIAEGVEAILKGWKFPKCFCAGRPNPVCR